MSKIYENKFLCKSIFTIFCDFRLRKQNKEFAFFIVLVFEIFSTNVEGGGGELNVTKMTIAVLTCKIFQELIKTKRKILLQTPPPLFCPKPLTRGSIYLECYGWYPNISSIKPNLDFRGSKSSTKTATLLESNEKRSWFAVTHEAHAL